MRHLLINLNRKDQIQPLTSFKSPRFKKFFMFGNALLWMLDKAALAPQFDTEVSGARIFGIDAGTLPLGLIQSVRNEGVNYQIGRSPSPIKQGDRVDDRTVLQPGGQHAVATCNGPAAAPASSGTTRARSTSPVKARDPARSSTPSCAAAAEFIGAASGAPGTPRKARAQFPSSPSKSQSSALSPGRARSGYAWPLGDSSIGETPLMRYRVRSNPPNLVVDVSDDEGQGQDHLSCPLIDQLRRIVRPAALSMGDFAPTFNLGPHMDVWMSARRLGVDQQLALLQAFVWSANSTEFCMTVGRPPVQLSVADAQYVWGLLRTWVVSLRDV